MFRLDSEILFAYKIAFDSERIRFTVYLTFDSIRKQLTELKKLKFGRLDEFQSQHVTSNQNDTISSRSGLGFSTRRGRRRAEPSTPPQSRGHPPGYPSVSPGGNISSGRMRPAPENFDLRKSRAALIISQLIATRFRRAFEN